MVCNVDDRGFSDSFHEGIVSLMAADYLENILVSTFGISRTKSQPIG